MRVSTNPLKKILDSPLARSILLSFLALAIIEGTFLATLSVLIIRADKKASNEFHQLRAANTVSQMMQIAGNLFYAIYREDKMAEALMSTRVHQWLKEASGQSVAIREAFRAANYGQTGLDAVEADFLYLQDLARDGYNQALPLSERQRRVFAHNEQTETIANNMLSKWQQIAPWLDNLNTSPPSASVDAGQALILLNLGIGTNLAALLLFLILANRGMIAPLRHLAANCKKLKSADLMDRPRSVRNEIGSLEQSFFQLSSIIFEDARRKLSNAEMLSAAQSTTLDRLALCFNQLKIHFTGSERAQRRMDSNLASIDRLKILLESLSDVLRSGNAKTDLNLQTCSTNNLIKSALSATESLCEQNGITVDVTDSSAQELTAQHEPVHQIAKGGELRADELLIVRVLVNLLSNAIKFSPQGQSIKLTVDQQNGMIRFRVIDKGPGISQSDIQKLFEPFRQVEGTTPSTTPSTGLGLSSCKATVERHNGKIGCDSTVGEGSTFWFTLPIEPHMSTQSSVNADASCERDNKPKSSIRKVLVLMLISFVLPQLALFANLNSKVQEVVQQARKFSEQKNQFVLMEDQLFRLLDFRNQIGHTTKKLDYAGAAPILNAYSEMMKRSRTFYKEYARDEFVHAQVGEIIKEQKDFFREFLKLGDDVFSVYEGSDKFKAAVDVSNKTLDRLFHVLRYQSSNAESAYTLTNDLSKELLATVAAAAVFDALALVLLSILGLRITNKISQLQQKAEVFAKGAELEKTIPGNDELAFLDKELVDASRVVTSAKADKQMLLTVINHDLRTPLASILAALETTKAGMHGELPDAETAIITEAEQDVVKLLNRINNLLTLEKIDANAFCANTSTFSLRECISAVIARSTSTTSTKAVQVEVNEAADGIMLSGDISLFETMLSEIVNNAIEAAPAGSRVTITWNRDTKVRIEISDRGAGVDEKLKPYIFDRFRFIDGKPLVGIGLPLAHRIAALHSGSISCQSCQASGTTFVLELPLTA